MKLLLNEQPLLTEETVDKLSMKLQEFLQKEKIDRANILRMRLAVEDALFRWLQGGLANTPVAVTLTKRFNKFIISLTVEGKAINPLVEKNDAIAATELTTYLQSITRNTNYQYRDEKNTLTISIPCLGLSSLAKIALAIVAAIVSGFLCQFFLPQFSLFFAKDIATPLYKLFLGVLGAVAAPVIFLSLLIGIVSIGSPQQFNTIGKEFVQHCLGTLCLLWALFSVIAILLLHPSSNGADSLGKIIPELGALLIKMIPTNLITPFANGNTVQIVILAIVFGTAILYMRETMDAIVELIYDVNKLLTSVLHVVCSFVPVLIYLCLVKIILEKGTDIMLPVLHLLIYLWGMFLVAFIALAVLVGITIKSNPLPVIRKIRKPLFIACTTTSSMAAFESTIAVCKEQLGIDHKLVNFSIPFGQSMVMAGVFTMYFVLTVFGSYLFNIPLSQTAIPLVGFTCIIATYGTPAINGGSILVFSMLLSNLKLPEEALSISLTAYILFNFGLTPLNVYANIMTTLRTAYKLNLVDKNILFNHK